MYASRVRGAGIGRRGDCGLDEVRFCILSAAAVRLAGSSLASILEESLCSDSGE